MKTVMLVMFAIVLSITAAYALNGVCEKCGRQFSFNPSLVIQDNKEKSVDPAEWGLCKRMTQGEVQAVLGAPSEIMKERPAFLSWYYPQKRLVVFDNQRSSGEYLLNYCITLVDPISVQSQRSTITCCYCGAVQDAQAALLRFGGTFKSTGQSEEQAVASSQSGQTAGLTLLGLAMSMQQAQQQDAAYIQTYQHNSNAFLQGMRQRTQSTQPTIYQPMSFPKSVTPTAPKFSYYEEQQRLMESSQKNSTKSMSAIDTATGRQYIVSPAADGDIEVYDRASQKTNYLHIE